MDGYKRAANAAAWALGAQKRNGFHVRRVVWGMVMARAEKREGEEIRGVTILVKAKRKRKKQSRTMNMRLEVTHGNTTTRGPAA
jgi:hypothetical protein